MINDYYTVLGLILIIIKNLLRELGLILIKSTNRNLILKKMTARDMCDKQKTWELGKPPNAVL